MNNDEIRIQLHKALFGSDYVTMAILTSCDDEEPVFEFMWEVNFCRIEAEKEEDGWKFRFSFSPMTANYAARRIGIPFSYKNDDDCERLMHNVNHLLPEHISPKVVTGIDILWFCTTPKLDNYPTTTTINQILEELERTSNAIRHL